MIFLYHNRRLRKFSSTGERLLLFEEIERGRSEADETPNAAALERETIMRKLDALDVADKIALQKKLGRVLARWSNPVEDAKAMASVIDEALKKSDAIPLSSELRKDPERMLSLAKDSKLISESDWKEKMDKMRLERSEGGKIQENAGHNYLGVQIREEGFVLLNQGESVRFETMISDIDRMTIPEVKNLYGAVWERLKILSYPRNRNVSEEGALIVLMPALEDKLRGARVIQRSEWKIAEGFLKRRDGEGFRQVADILATRYASASPRAKPREQIGTVPMDELKRQDAKYDVNRDEEKGRDLYKLRRDLGGSRYNSATDEERFGPAHTPTVNEARANVHRQGVQAYEKALNEGRRDIADAYRLTEERYQRQEDEIHRMNREKLKYYAASVPKGIRNKFGEFPVYGSKDANGQPLYQYFLRAHESDPNRDELYALSMDGTKYLHLNRSAGWRWQTLTDVPDFLKGGPVPPDATPPSKNIPNAPVERKGVGPTLYSRSIEKGVRYVTIFPRDPKLGRTGSVMIDLEGGALTFSPREGAATLRELGVRLIPQARDSSDALRIEFTKPRTLWLGMKGYRDNKPFEFTKIDAAALPGSSSTTSSEGLSREAENTLPGTGSGERSPFEKKRERTTTASESADKLSSLHNVLIPKTVGYMIIAKYPPTRPGYMEGAVNFDVANRQFKPADGAAVLREFGLRMIEMPRTSEDAYRIEFTQPRTLWIGVKAYRSNHPFDFTEINAKNPLKPRRSLPSSADRPPMPQADSDPRPDTSSKPLEVQLTENQIKEKKNAIMKTIDRWKGKKMPTADLVKIEKTLEELLPVFGKKIANQSLSMEFIGLNLAVSVFTLKPNMIENTPQSKAAIKHIEDMNSKMLKAQN